MWEDTGGCRRYETGSGCSLPASGSRTRYSWCFHRTHPRVELRETQVLFRIVAAVLALVAAAGSPPVHAQFAGRALVTDGHTVRLAGERVRLHGIDAPESKQTCVAGSRRWRCGSEATRALARRIGGRPIPDSSPRTRSHRSRMADLVMASVGYRVEFSNCHKPIRSFGLLLRLAGMQPIHAVCRAQAAGVRAVPGREPRVDMLRRSQDNVLWIDGPIRW